MTDQTRLEDRYIVVGVDSSHGSRAALGWALVQARLTGAAVEVVAAWQQPATYEYSYGSLPFPSSGDSIAATNEKILAETVADVVGTGNRTVDVRTKVAHGPAAQVLLEAAAGADSWSSAAAATAPSPACPWDRSVSTAPTTRRTP